MDRKKFNQFSKKNENNYYILEKKPEDILIDRLMLTATEGDVNEIKKMCISYNLHLSITNSTTQNSILHFILPHKNLTEKQKEDIVKFLNLHNSLVSTHNIYFITPIHIACKYQYYNILKILLDNDHDIQNKDSYNNTVIHYCLNGTSIEISSDLDFSKLRFDNGIYAYDNRVLELLIEYGADINYKNSFNESPLTIAILTGNIEAITTLINNSVAITNDDIELNNKMESYFKDMSDDKYVDIEKIDIERHIKNNLNEPKYKFIYYSLNKHKNIKIYLENYKSNS